MEHVITESPYLCSPNILWHPDAQTKAVALDFAGTGGCIKAGSPISAAGKVANDASAVGVLLHDAHELCCSHGLVVIGGYIKSDIAQNHSGIEISDAARSAMSRLAFIGADGAPDKQTIPYECMPDGYPKKSGWSIEWDGNTDGLVCAAGMYYNSQEFAISKYNIERSSSFKVTITNGETVTKLTVEGNGVNKDFDGYIVIGDYAIYCQDNTQKLMGNIEFPQTGLYFIKHPTSGYVSKLEAYEAIPMDEAYMPVLTSPNETKYKITVDDTGALSTVKVV